MYDGVVAASPASKVLIYLISTTQKVGTFFFISSCCSYSFLIHAHDIYVRHNDINNHFSALRVSAFHIIVVMTSRGVFPSLYIAVGPTWSVYIVYLT